MPHYSSFLKMRLNFFFLFFFLEKKEKDLLYEFPLKQNHQSSRTRLSDLTFTFHFLVSEKEMATHSSVLAWRIPGTEEPGGLSSMGSHRAGHDWSDLAAAAVILNSPLASHLMNMKCSLSQVAMLVGLEGKLLTHIGIEISKQFRDILPLPRHEWHTESRV